MARTLARTVTTVERQRGSMEGDSFGGRLRAVIPNTGRLTIIGYCEAFFHRLNEADASLHVFKRLKSSGQFTKKGEIRTGEVEPQDIESHLVQLYGVGTYQLRPEYKGRYYGPVSMAFRLGEEAEDDLVPPRVTSTEDTQGAIDTTIKQLGQVAVARKLKEAVSGGSEMDMGGIASLIQAQQAPLIEMMRQTEARAVRAEERVNQLLDKMMDQRTQVASGQAPLFAEVLKTAVGNPEVLSVLLHGEPKPESSWVETIRDVVREVAPYLQQIVGRVMQHSQIGPVPVTALPGGATDKMSVPGPTRVPGPAPTGASTEGDSMPIPMNEEQELAKGLLVDFVVKGDFANAYAVLESFPGFVPIGTGGAMPLGEFIISKIDPAVNPKVYLPQLGMLIPDLRKTLPQAEAFIKHIQDRIVADDEAARREGSVQGAPGPEPTRGGDA